MRIAIVSQTFPFTPSNSTAPFMYDFARGFTNLGHTVFVLVPFHPRLRTSDFPDIRIRTFRYGSSLLGYGRTLVNDQNIPWYVYILTPLYIFCCTLALFRLVKREHIDVINTHWIVPNGFCTAIVSRITGIPLVITLPGTDAYLATTNILARWMASMAIRQAKTIVSNSPQLLQDLRVSGHTISYGVPENQDKRTTHTGVVVATAGRPVEKKGFILLSTIHPPVRILSGLPIRAFRKTLLGVDIFVAPSIRDRRGNLDDASLVVLEAMAAGCAVIVSDLPGYRTIIQNGKNGILCAPNPHAFAHAIRRLQKSTLLRQSLGAAARKTIMNRFTPDIVASKYLKLFS